MRGGERKVKEKEKKKAALRQRQQLTEVVGFMSRRGRRVCPVLQSAVLQPRRRRDGGKREGEARGSWHAENEHTKETNYVCLPPPPHAADSIIAA